MPVFFPERDFSADAAGGQVSGYSTVNKFGLALDCDNGVPTDIWDGADGSTSTDLWAGPTATRVHDIVSTSVNDTSAGTGARTIRISGLTSWDSAEVTEDVTLNGTSNVATVNSFVIIHRMKCLTFGSLSSNEGIITATAQVDSTITAAIQAGEGQTLMAIYGVPSTKVLLLVGLYSTVLGGSGVDITGRILVNENADQPDSGFIAKSKWAIRRDNNFLWKYIPPRIFSGPCIVKVQATSDANNADVAAGFDGYLVDK